MIMIKKKIAILGASYLQKPLFEKAKEMGIETHCFAWEDGAVCKDIADFFYPISVLDKEAILEVCSSVKIDGITTIATDICIPTISFVGVNLNLIVNSIHSSLISTNKGLMRKAFNDFGLLSPKYNIVSKFNLNLLRDFDNPKIVKPVDRSGSRGITKVLNKQHIKNAVKKSIEESITGQAIIEDFIEGVEVSVEAISWNGKHTVLAITDKVTTNAPHFVELEHHQPSFLSNEIKERIIDLTNKSLQSLNIEYGASHSEFKITESGEIYVIEVGARMGGDFIGSDLIQLSTGYDYLKGVIDVALNRFDKPILNTKERCYSGVYFLSKESERLLKYFECDQDYIIDKKIMNTNLKFLKESNDRSGFLIYKSSKKIKL